MTKNQDSTHTDRLLERASLGDRQAVNELISSHQRYLRVLSDLRMDDALRVRVDPSDVVQETQLVANQRLDDFLQRRPTSFRIWLRRKALERLVDMRRRHVHAEKRSVRREITLSDRSSMALAKGMLPRSPSEIVRKRETAQLVRSAVEELKTTDREVLLFRHVEGLTNSEASEVMDVDAATASQRYGRALRRLREELVRRGICNEE